MNKNLLVERDSMGRMTHRICFDKEYFFRYHENGKLEYEKEIDESGPCESWHDDRGNMIHFKFKDFEVFSDYDSSGNEIHTKYEDGSEYWYDTTGKTIRTKEASDQIDLLTELKLAAGE